MLVFFFFKQKTAYEMRISDWNSDVCSSDLALAERESSRRFSPFRSNDGRWKNHHDQARGSCADHSDRRRRASSYQRERTSRTFHRSPHLAEPNSRATRSCARFHSRSEEHKSELQSLMRKSYAVFCLKK